MVIMRRRWLCEALAAAWCLILVNGTAAGVTKECSKGEHPVYTAGGPICCPTCDQHSPQESCEHEKMECRCRRGYGCKTESCTDCIELPKCNGGRLNRTVTHASFYSYGCENCQSGTVLDMESGLCTPSEMSSTTIPSRSTKSPSTTELSVNVSDNYNSITWIFIWVSLFFCLLLITILIHLLIRKMKTAKSLKMEDLVQTHTSVQINTKEDGDTWSYQYPEEEHGDGVPSNKLAAF